MIKFSDYAKNYLKTETPDFILGKYTFIDQKNKLLYIHVSSAEN